MAKYLQANADFLYEKFSLLGDTIKGTYFISNACYEATDV